MGIMNGWRKPNLYLAWFYQNPIMKGTVVYANCWELSEVLLESDTEKFFCLSGIPWISFEFTVRLFFSYSESRAKAKKPQKVCFEIGILFDFNTIL